MAARKWHSGPPPHVGWWNASCFKNEAAWRWWNGKFWSHCAWDNWTASEARAAASGRVGRNDAKSGILWSDYWPPGARVPRIDPAATTGDAHA